MSKKQPHIYVIEINDNDEIMINGVAYTKLHQKKKKLGLNINLQQK